jgi:hypothetical protein
MQCPVSINYWRRYSEFIHFVCNVECVLVRSASSSWIHALSNARQRTLAVVLFHQLSSSALRKEVSGYKCGDVIVSRLICILSRVYLYLSRMRALRLVLSHCALHRVGGKCDVVFTTDPGAGMDG